MGAEIIATPEKPVWLTVKRWTNFSQGYSHMIDTPWTVRYHTLDSVRSGRRSHCDYTNYSNREEAIEAGHARGWTLVNTWKEAGPQLDAIRRQERQSQPPRDFNRRLIPRFLIAMQMSLQLDIYIVPPENFAELPHAFDSGFHSAAAQRMRQRTFFAARQADQAAGMFRQLFSGNRAFAFRGAQLHPRDQAAKILITSL